MKITETKGKAHLLQGGLYPYRSSKAGLNAVTKSLSLDLAPLQVKWLHLLPSFGRYRYSWHRKKTLFSRLGHCQSTQVGCRLTWGESMHLLLLRWGRTVFMGFPIFGEHFCANWYDGYSVFVPLTTAKALVWKSLVANVKHRCLLEPLIPLFSFCFNTWLLTYIQLKIIS